MDLKKYIIYEDSDILAINKPSGLLSIPDGFDVDKPNLRDLVTKFSEQIFVVHRLDKLTSGVVVFGKNAVAHRQLNILFTERLINKLYFAFAHGTPIWSQKTVDFPLRVNGDRRHRTVFDEKQGKAAHTDIKVSERKNSFFSCEINPKTGYTHQIRAHLSLLGHPVVGDDLYSRLQPINMQKRPESEGRHFYLHALALEINDFNGKNIKIQAELPEYFFAFDPDSGNY